jgi:HAE1 family hydrophobic/amphiphilic exporter-1
VSSREPSGPTPEGDRPEGGDERGAAPPEGGLSFVTTRPVAILMLMFAVSVFGLVSLGKLPVDLLPDISYPTVTVRSTYRGAAPEDVEDRISERIQEALSTLPDLVRSTSISRAEVSDVVLDFDWGTEMAFAVQDIRDKLDGVFLPDGAERPLILRYDPNLDPILRLGLTLPPSQSARLEDEEGRVRALVQLRWLAENRIKRELETTPGVAAVQVRGGLEEEIRVRVDPYKMSAQGLDPAVLAARLAQENINASSGLIREGSTEYLVRTLNEFQDIEEIEDLAVEQRGEAVIRVRDVATVDRTHAEREVVTSIDGGEAVEIAIYREAGANIVELAEAVKAKVFGTEEQQQHAAKMLGSGETHASWEDRSKTDFVAHRLRKDARIELLSDQSTFIRAAVDDVRSAALLGALLAVLVIWIFLRNLASTMIIGLAIPISVVATFAPMYVLDVSLNIMSLGGLALGVGMLVDNAIVVLESINRCRDEGDEMTTAAIRGVREVAGAITASTLTSVAVFAPIVFVHGIAGQIFGDQAVTVVSSLLVSLLVAVMFIPMLASRKFLVAGTRGTSWRQARPARLTEGLRWNLGSLVSSLLVLLGRVVMLALRILVRIVGALAYLVFVVGRYVTWPLRVAFDAGWRALAALYDVLIRHALRQAWIVAIVVGLLGWGAYERVGGLGVELLPEIHQGEFTMFVALGVGTPLEETEEVLAAIDKRIRALPEVSITALTVGVETDALTREIEGKHTARLTVRLKPEHASYDDEERAVEAARRLVAANPAVRSIDVRRPTPFALDAPITVEILGRDLESMKEVTLEVERRLLAIDDLADVRSSVRPGHPEARVTFDRDKMLEYGLDLSTVATFVRDQVLGNVSTRFTEGDERIDVRVMGDELVLSDLDSVLSLVVNPDAETPVELSSVATIEHAVGDAEVRRIGNTRAMLVTATSSGLDLGGIQDRITAALADLQTPEDVSVQLGGQKREMEEAQSSMRFALFLALFLVYVVMACQFESLLQPLIILVTVPLAAVGVVYVLDALAMPLSVTVFIGMILLAGIVVNNAIVLVDRINQRRALGEPLFDAVVEGGVTRLRPIMMTTATTVLGLLPLTGWLETLPGLEALSSGEGAEIRAPMAVTVVAGLTVSTLLTLIVIPVVYYAFARGGELLAGASAPRLIEPGSPTHPPLEEGASA